MHVSGEGIRLVVCHQSTYYYYQYYQHYSAISVVPILQDSANALCRQLRIKQKCLHIVCIVSHCAVFMSVHQVKDDTAAAVVEPEVEMKDVVEVDSEKEVEATASTESMDVEIVGVTAAENDDKSDSVKLDEESSEKDREKKRDSEESGMYRENGRVFLTVTVFRAV